MKALVSLAVLSLALVLPRAGQAQTPPAWRSGDVPVAAGVNIHYVEAGDPQAAVTLLFVPGWATSSTIWRDQMAAFAGSARVVSIDPRSQGDSTVTPRSNTPEQRAKDLREVMRRLSLGPVVLVGWSQGVQDVAAYAAAFEGEGVSRYVLVDAAVGAGAAAALSRPAELQATLERTALYQQHPAEYLRGMMNAIIRSPEGRARIDDYVAVGLRTPPDLGISMLLMDFIAIDRRPALAKFNRPTLVIAAADSSDVQAQRAMAQAIQGARFEVIDNAGHAVFLDQPQRFRALLADFIKPQG